MHQDKSKRNIYFENLDALRFFAFLSVFISHIALFLGYESNNPSFNFIKKGFLIHGDLGVSFFFVLSGFLITFLLITEKERLGKISLIHFYLRRILRIWPLYFLTLILGFFVIYPIASNSLINFPFLITESYTSLPWYLFFGANVKMAFFGAGSVVLAVLWSISIEEQFYIVWPTVISFVSRKNIIKILFLIIGISFLYRFYYYDNYNIVKYSTFSVMSDLAVGAFLAYITMYIPRIVLIIKNCPKYIIGVIYVFGFALVPLRTLLPIFSHGYLYRFLYSFEPLLFSIFFAFIIFEQNVSEHSLLKLGRSKIINYLGARSYGLYCYHMIAIFCTFYIFHLFGMPDTNHNFIIYILEIIMAFLLVVIFSVISYRYFEKKLLNLKEKYGYKTV